MKSIKTLGLAAVMALVLVACVGASSASATTICVSGTANTAACPAGSGPGGAYTATSTNSQLAVSGGGTISCTNATISGTAPATSGTTVTGAAQLRYSGCTAFGIAATVTPNATCDSGITLTAGYVGATAPQAWTRVNLPSGCVITISIPALSCTVTVSGAQTIGNGTTGTNGQAWTNGTPSPSPVFSKDVINSDTMNAVSSGGGFGCPTAGSHTSTLTGTYTVTSPSTAPGVTIQP